MGIEFYLMLHPVGINQNSIGDSHIVILFYQKAVGSKLHYMAPMGLYCLAAFDLHRDQPAIPVPDDVIRFAGKG